MSDSQARTAPAATGWVWRAYLGVVALAAAAYFAPIVPFRAAMLLYVVIIATTPVAIVVGVWLHRPAHRRPWWLVAGGLTAIVIGDAIWTSEDYVTWTFSSSSLVDAVYVLGYVLVAAGLLAVARIRLPGRDRDAAIDAAIVATSAALASWVLLMAPYATDGTLTTLEKATALAQPAMVVLQLAILARLAFAGGRPPLALVVVMVGTTAWLAADAVYSYQALTDAYVDRGPVDLGWLLGNVVWAAVALHPSMVTITGSTSVRTRPPGRGRVALLAAAALLTPALGLLELARDGRRSSLAILAIGSGLMFVLVVIRLDGLARRLSLAALHDELTGLPNRMVLVDRLTVAMARARRTGRSAAVLFIDLDRFKQVNDTLGHGAGDELLIEVAHRLRTASREADTVARFGGDEFVVLCEDIGGVADTHQLAGRLLEALRRPLAVRGTSFFVSASIGGAMIDAASDDPERVLRDADTALYRAKEHGRGRYELFDQAARVEAVRRSRVERELHRALDADELRVRYQPIVRLASEAMVGVEALVRWRHPERGLVGPDEFLDVAEETGLIVPIGHHVMASAIGQLGAWHRGGAADLHLSLNLSPRELLVPGLVDRLAAEMGAAGVDPSRICIEVTEGAVFHDLTHGSRVLHQLRALGVAVAMDDFGTGYSSLTYLRELPVQLVKLDRSFLRSVGEDAAARSIVRAVVELAGAVGVTVLAEGIETDAQRDLLLDLGCELGQGFLWSPAVPAAEIDPTATIRPLGHAAPG
ncbi:MAG TPA: EAL domain-containing protein [Acidimicrobiales bacterium]|nr:EAL domain-containing protein [Acidimicrobiales bacterium]